MNSSSPGNSPTSCAIPWRGSPRSSTGGRRAPGPPPRPTPLMRRSPTPPTRCGRSARPSSTRPAPTRGRFPVRPRSWPNCGGSRTGSARPGSPPSRSPGPRRWWPGCPPRCWNASSARSSTMRCATPAPMSASGSRGSPRASGWWSPTTGPASRPPSARTCSSRAGAPTPGTDTAERAWGCRSRDAWPTPPVVRSPSTPGVCPVSGALGGVQEETPASASSLGAAFLRSCTCA